MVFFYASFGLTFRQYGRSHFAEGFIRSAGGRDSPVKYLTLLLALLGALFAVEATFGGDVSLISFELVGGAEAKHTWRVQRGAPVQTGLGLYKSGCAARLMCV